MTISPLPASHSTMAQIAANHTAPARGAGETNNDGGQRGRDQDEQFVSALSAASGSKSADDATISEDQLSEGPRTKSKPVKAKEEDSGRRATLAQAWHTTMTGMPAPDASGALALPASLLAHGQLAIGTGTAGDIDADAPAVAVVGIGVVTDADGGIPTGPVLNPATLGRGGQGPGGGFAGLAGLHGLPTGEMLTGPASVTGAGPVALTGAGPAAVTGAGAAALAAAALAGDGAAATTGADSAARAFGLPALAVVPAGEARPAVEAAITANALTANANSAAAAAALAEVDLSEVDPAALTEVALPAAGGAAGAFDLAAVSGTSTAGPGDVGAVPVLTKSGRQLSPAELAATQATAAQNAAAQVAAVQATTLQLGHFLEPEPGAAVGAVTATPGGPLPVPDALPGYVPGAVGVGAAGVGAAGVGAGTAGGADGDEKKGDDPTFTDTLAAATGTTAPDVPGFTPLHAPDLSPAPQLDLSGAGAPDQAPPPPPAAQVADQIIPLRTQGDGVHRIAMELRPNDLGTISVVAEIRNGQVHLHFGGANEMTRETLRAALPELRQQLEDAGFAGAAFDFGDGSPPGQNDRRQLGGAGQGQNGGDQGAGNRSGRSGEPGSRGGETTRQTGQRQPGYGEPTPTGAGHHALDLQV